MGNCRIELENGLKMYCDILSVNLDSQYPILEIQVYGSQEIVGDYLKNRHKKRRKFKLFRRFAK